MTEYALAIDLGGTKIEAALVSRAGVVEASGRSRRPTGRDIDPAALTAAVAAVTAEAIAALPAGSMLVGAGIGSAGPIDFRTEQIFPVNMPGVRGFGLAESARTALRAHGYDVPVRQRHDGGCIALGESWKGATAGARASMSIIVSTGLGGGVVIDGNVIGGASGNAGHIGQVAAPAGFDVPEFAGVPTVEDVVSGPASVRWARAQGWQGAQGEDLGRDAAAGDEIARAAIERSARGVGIVLADAATLIDLEVIAVGGGFSHVSPDYVSLVEAALRAAAALPYSQAARVVRAGLGGDAPLVGAAALVLA